MAYCPLGGPCTLLSAYTSSPRTPPSLPLSAFASLHPTHPPTHTHPPSPHNQILLPGWLLLRLNSGVTSSRKYSLSFFWSSPKQVRYLLCKPRVYPVPPSYHTMDLAHYVALTCFLIFFLSRIWGLWRQVLILCASVFLPFNKHHAHSWHAINVCSNKLNGFLACLLVHSLP